MSSAIVPFVLSETRIAPASAEPLEAHRRFLWGLCYRMTGSAEDADDLVQETFIRALENPPPDASLPLRPWLVRVAMNLSRDALRRRKRRRYVGPWLPMPVDGTGDLDGPGDEPSAAPEQNPEARYGLAESASFAFLIALEALTPSQRAVLLLRDAFDFSVRETAEALGITESNVKTTHHRARASMESYERKRRPLDEALRMQTQELLSRLLVCVASGDLAGFRDLLADDAVVFADGGGVTFAARIPVRGPEKIARLYTKLARRASPKARLEIRLINGLPAVLVEDPEPLSPTPTRGVLRIEVGPDGLIRELHSLAAPAKLARIARIE